MTFNRMNDGSQRTGRWRAQVEVEVEVGSAGSSPGGVDDEEDLVAAWQGEGE